MIKNQTNNNSDAHINALRKAFEHRATWYALLVDEAKKRGVDISFARDAITRCGCIDGVNKFPQTNDINEFAKVFATDDIKKIFDMDTTIEGNTMTCVFHYCPLVTAWQRLGLSDEEIETLCDIAMDGDRAIASQNPHLSFELGDTIGAGDMTCLAKFTMKE